MKIPVYSTQKRSGQVVTEYLLILCFVVAALATTKIKIDVTGQVDWSGAAEGSQTIMEILSRSYTVWLQDVLIILSLPS